MEICFSTFLKTYKIEGYVYDKLNQLDGFFDASYGEHGRRCHLKDSDLEAQITKDGKLSIQKYSFAHFIAVDNILFISNRVTTSGNKVYQASNYDDLYKSIPGDDEKVKDRKGKKVTEENVDLIISGIMIEYSKLLRKAYVTNK